MFRIDKTRVQLGNVTTIPLSSFDTAAESDTAAANNEALQAAPLVMTSEVSGPSAEEILAEARQQAEQEARALLLAAQTEAAALRQDALDNGYTDGLQEGLAQGKAEYAAQIQAGQTAIAAALAEIANAHDEVFTHYERDIIDLALAIAQKILNYELYKNDQALQSIISNALGKMSRESKISIRVSEEIANIFFNSDSATFVLADGSVDAKIIADDTLQDDQFMLESTGESIDASIRTQLRNITIALGRQTGDQE